MLPLTALKIVLDLAKQNVLDEDENWDEMLAIRSVDLYIKHAHHDEALALLREFVKDVDVVRQDTRESWPDLFVTFQKAEQLLIRIGTGG